MDFFSSSRGKKDGKRSSGLLFGKKSASKSNPASPPHPADRRSPPPSYLPNKRAETEYDFPFSNDHTTYRKQPASERIPNSHSRPPVYGYGTPERRRDHGRERMEAVNYEPETNAPSSPFHSSANRTPERRRKPSEYSREHQDRMYEADTRSIASPFHPFKSPSPSPYHTPDRRRDQDRDYYYEAMYEPEANIIFQRSAPGSPLHPAGSRSPSPYRTPDRRSNHGNQQFEDLYERDGDVTPQNSSPPSPFHPAASRSPPPQPYRTPDRQFEAMYEADGDVMPQNSAPASPVHGGAPPFAYYSSSDEDNLSTYLFPEIATPPRSMPISGNSTPVHHNYQIVAAETYEQEKQYEPPELPDESQGFTLEEMAKMRGLEKEESRSMISEAQVTVAKYRVRASVAETLQAILDKYGDIAAGSKLQSTVTRSYYLESLAAVVMELRAKELKELTKTRVEEMAAVVKDMESVKIDVSWLKKTVVELGEAVEHLGEYEAAKAEREACEREAKEGKGKMEEMREELKKKEKEMRESREKVTVAAGKVGELEMKGAKLKKKIDMFQSKVDKFQGEAVLLHL